MPDSFGLSFSPLDQNGNGEAVPREAQGGASPLQDAIRVLSLRIPRVVGAGGIAAAPLLGSPGSAGVGPTGQVPGGLDEFLRRILFGQMPGASGITPSAGGAPLPHVGPGSQAPVPEPPQWGFGEQPLREIPANQIGERADRGIGRGPFQRGGF